MADRAAAELQHHVLAQIGQQLVHLAGMDAARGHRHQLASGWPRAGRRRCRVAGPSGTKLLAAGVVNAAITDGSPSSLPTTVPAWMWSTPAMRIHFAITRNETPWFFCRV
jgi:hypothetical protein